MEWVETMGRTVEEALDEALDRLGVDERDAEFEVIEEPKAGLFGRLRSEARVRARVRPTQPRPKNERAERPRRRRAANPGGRPRPDSPAQAPVQTEASPSGNGAGREDSVPLAEQAEVARDFLSGLMNVLGMPASVDVHELDEETVEVAVTGQDLGLLIGPKGTTLSSLQDLTRTVVNRRTGGRNGRLLVDVAGYRQKRKEALERFTNQVAAEVKATGTAKYLEAMSPADRKVVHDTVNAIDGVTTRSEGEEPRRRVVIAPT